MANGDLIELIDKCREMELDDNQTMVVLKIHTRYGFTRGDMDTEISVVGENKKLLLELSENTEKEILERLKQQIQAKLREKKKKEAQNSDDGR